MIYDPFTARLESGGRDDAVNPYSGATGLYQFMPGTVADLHRRFPNIEQEFAGRPLTDRAYQNALKMALDRTNAPILRQAIGREPGPVDLYLAHRFGAGGGRAMLQAPRETPLQDVLRGVFTGRGTPSFDAVMRQNPDLARFQTVGDMLDFYNRRAGLPSEAPAAAPQAPAQNDFVSRVMAGSLSGDPRVQQARDTLLGSLTAADNPSLADLGQAAMSMAGSVGPVNLQQTLAGVQNQRAQRAAQVLQMAGQDENRLINLLRLDAERGGKAANALLTAVQRLGDIDPAQRAQIISEASQRMASGGVRTEQEVVALVGELASRANVRRAPGAPVNVGGRLVQFDPATGQARVLHDGTTQEDATARRQREDVETATRTEVARLRRSGVVVTPEMESEIRQEFAGVGAQRRIAGSGGIGVELRPDGTAIFTQGNAQGMTGSQRGQVEIGLRNQAAAVERTGQLMRRIDEQIGNVGASGMGLAGLVLRGLDSYTQQISDTVRLLQQNAPEGEPAALRRAIEANRDTISRLSQLAGQSAGLNSNIINLAYLIARAQNPTGPITGPDFAQGLRTIGGDSPEQLRHAMREAFANAINAYDAAYRQHNKGQSPPNIDALRGLYGAPAPAAGGAQAPGADGSIRLPSGTRIFPVTPPSGSPR